MTHTINQKQYQELETIELKAFDFRCSMKKWNADSKRLQNYRRQWKTICEKLQILENDGMTARYVVVDEFGNTIKSYLHGYSFSDVLA